MGSIEETIASQFLEDREVEVTLAMDSPSRAAVLATLRTRSTAIARIGRRRRRRLKPALECLSQSSRTPSC